MQCLRAAVKLLPRTLRTVFALQLHRDSHAGDPAPICDIDGINTRLLLLLFDPTADDPPLLPEIV